MIGFSGFDTVMMFGHIAADVSRLKAFRKYISPMDFNTAWDDLRGRYELYRAFVRADGVKLLGEAA